MPLAEILLGVWLGVTCLGLGVAACYAPDTRGRHVGEAIMFVATPFWFVILCFWLAAM